MIRIYITPDGKLHIGAIGSPPTDPWTTDQWQAVQLRWLDSDNNPLLHAVGATIVLSLKESRTATALLASANEFTRPTDSTGFYEGLLSLITGQLSSLADGAAVYLEIKWTVSGKLYRSDPLRITLIKPLTADTDAVPTDSSAAARAAWLANNILAGNNITISANNTAGTITITASGGGGSAPVYSAGFLRFTASDGNQYDIAALRVD